MRAVAVTVVVFQRKNGTSPLSGQGRRDLLVRNNTQPNEPTTQALPSFVSLGLEGDLQLVLVNRTATQKYQPERQAMLLRKRFVRKTHKLIKNGSNPLLEAVQAAIPTALEEDAFVMAPLQKPSPGRTIQTLIVFALQVLPPERSRVAQLPLFERMIDSAKRIESPQIPIVGGGAPRR